MRAAGVGQGVAVWAQPRCLGVLGFTTSLNGLKNSPTLTPKADKIAASPSTVTPLSPRSSLAPNGPSCILVWGCGNLGTSGHRPQPLRQKLGGCAVDESPSRGPGSRLITPSRASGHEPDSGPVVADELSGLAGVSLTRTTRIALSGNRLLHIHVRPRQAATGTRRSLPYNRPDPR